MMKGIALPEVLAREYVVEKIYVQSYQQIVEWL